MSLQPHNSFITFPLDHNSTPQVIFINRTQPPQNMVKCIDYWIAGETDAWCNIFERHIYSAEDPKRFLVGSLPPSHINYIINSGSLTEIARETAPISHLVANMQINGE